MRAGRSALSVPLFITIWFAVAFFFFTDDRYSLLRDLSILPSYDRGGQNSQPARPERVKDGKILPAGNISLYLGAIFDTAQTNLPTLQCPKFDENRYKTLQAVDRRGSGIQWFFALNLRNSLELLPRLLGSIIEAIRFLGPQHCALSIVEGLSPDGTADVLIALEDGLKAMGVRYFFQSSTVDSKVDHRIVKLAELRNLALQPLLFNPASATEDAAVIFINDVAACTDDILELVYQRQSLRADMISRDINGESFFKIGDMGEWDRANYLFWDSPVSKARFEANRPFQVFACWNGGTVMSARPFLEQNIRFRASNDKLGECFMGEPQLLCKDLWFHGYDRIAIVPSVNLDYALDRANKTKLEKGFVTEIVGEQDPSDDRINTWLGPPDKVRCMAGFDHQSMVAWNETLTHD
ncbi:hypothetical protein QQS21_008196 [Conoideocrella luteorostrata]|uniref:Alpha-1,3-mannosyltransferase CMT1 n=1 Tax=Conoideocrella luteorostrata TaxID=1105319 RepID=A0AAJ0CLM9_9HYPO|nr:hypothetical protein QQS21_008196 [Conoideocrella luteorostrata]